MVHDSEPTLIAGRDDNEHGPLDIATGTQSRRKALLRFILFVALAVGFTLLALVVVFWYCTWFTRARPQSAWHRWD